MSLWYQARPYLSSTVRFLRISYLEARSDYEGTRLGLLWLPLSTVIFTLMLAFVFRHSDTMPQSDFFLYVLSGYVIWLLITDTISGSTDIIQKRLEFAVHNNLSLAGLFLKLLTDRLFEYFINLVVLLIALILLSPARMGFNLLLFFPFVGLVALSSLALSYLVNIATILMPDSGNLIKTGMRFIFFASPVFWIPTGKGDHFRNFLVTFNPVSYYLNISRQTFGVAPIEYKMWAITIAFSLVIYVAGIAAYLWSRQFVRNIK